MYFVIVLFSNESNIVSVLFTNESHIKISNLQSIKKDTDNLKRLRSEFKFHRLEERTGTVFTDFL